MTDTRKEFEQFVLDNMRTDAPNFINERRFAEKSWQACQQLNDKRIQQLLAVIELKDTALANVIVADRFCAETNISDEHRQAKADAHHEAILSVEAALAIKPEDVELVEVGKVREIGGSLFASQYSPNNGVKVGDIVYTIKQKD